MLLEDITRLVLEGKGGNYRLVGTEWQLQTPEGWQRVPNPMNQVWDAAMQLRDALGDHMERKPFITVNGAEKLGQWGGGIMYH